MLCFHWLRTQVNCFISSCFVHLGLRSLAVQAFRLDRRQAGGQLGTRNQGRAARLRPLVLPCLEVLEDRWVPSAVWYVNSAAVGNNTGLSWTNAFTDLQAALATAQSGDQIWTAQGTYKPTNTADRNVSFVLKDGVEVYGGFGGTETLLTQRDSGLHITTLSGDIGTPGDNSDNSYHVLTSNNLSSAAILDGFTITGGAAHALQFPQRGGGGMYNDRGSPTLRNLTFSSNSADYGGGMYNFDLSSPTLTNVTFSSNSSVLDGGGMYNNDYSSPTLTNVTFSNDSAGSSGGGGMFNVTSSPTLTNVIFSNNHAGFYGGGMINDLSSPTLINVTFSGNTAYQGGALYNYEQSSLMLTNCILWGNTAFIAGSQILNSQDSTTTVSYSDVQGGWTGTGNIDADPLFVDAAHDDLHLQSGSPAIDAGTDSNAPLYDRDNQQRPFDGNGDGTATTDMGAYEFQFVNHAPSFSSGPDQTILEDAGAQTVPGWATNITAGPPDEANQILSFLVSNDNPVLFLVQPSLDAAGNLTYTPAPNASGTAIVTVQLQDNGGTANGGTDTSAPQQFAITIQFINDAPSFSEGLDQNVPANSGAHTVACWATNITPDGNAQPAANEAAQGLSFLVSTSSPNLFAVQPAISSTGTLTYTVAPNSYGIATITVQLQDNGGTAFGGQDTSPPQTFTISVKGGNSLSLSSIPNPSVFGQSVIFTATVSPVGSGTGTPTGKVDFFDVTTNTDLGATPLLGFTATLITAGLSVQDHLITATYLGDGNFPGSSISMVQTVNQATTTTALTINPTGNVSFGTSLTFTARVTADFPSTGIPTGTVTFWDGVVPVGTGTLDGTGLASFSTSTLPVNFHTITAVYNGGGNYAPSPPSNAVNFTVMGGTTATGITSISPNPATFGLPVTLTALVQALQPFPGQSLTGSVTFMAGSTPIPGFATQIDSGLFRETVILPPSLNPGTLSITATYNPNGPYTPSLSGPVSLSYNPALTTLSLSPASSSRLFGSAPNITATVSSSGGIPSGWVTFTDRNGNTVAGQQTVALDSSGQAVFSLNSLHAGTYTVTATFTGASNSDGSTDFSSSISTVVTYTVKQAGSNITLFPKAVSAVHGQPVTFTANVLSSTQFAPTSGTVNFTWKVGTITNTRAVPLTSANPGQASLTLQNLAIGFYTVSASFVGNSDMAASNSGTPSTMTITGKAATISLRSSPPSGWVTGQTVVLIATVTSTDIWVQTGPGTFQVGPMVLGIGIPTGTVTFKDGPVVFGTATLNQLGVATLSVSNLNFGLHTLTAFYNGNDIFAAGPVSALLLQYVAHPATTKLVSLTNPLVVNNGTGTLTASVTGSYGVPTGTVTFTFSPVSPASLPQVVSPPIPLDSGGKATVSLANLAPGIYTVAAAYSSDDPGKYGSLGPSPALKLIVVVRFDHLSTGASITGLASKPLHLPTGLLQALDSNGQLVGNYSATVRITLDPNNTTPATLNGGKSVIASMINGKLQAMPLTLIPVKPLPAVTKFTLDVTDPATGQVLTTFTVTLANSPNHPM